MSHSIDTVAVLGAGTMGHGIAQVAAAAGCDVRLFDERAEALESARVRIANNLDGAIQRGKTDAATRDAILDRLTLAPNLADAAGGADLVIEAIHEDLDAKRALLRAVEPHVADDALLATNTSSISIGRIAEAAVRPARVIGMHFFNPVHIMKLIEVVVHEGGSDATRDAAVAFGERMGKDPIVVRDTPGFASSRLGVVLGLEAMRMVEQEVASPESIDTAMRLGYGHPMGPLRLTDLVGLDVRLAIARFLHDSLGGAQYEPPQILIEKVERGELGKKSGQGFYDWSNA